MGQVGAVQDDHQPDGTYRIPSTPQWSGRPGTWNPASPGANSGLHVTFADYTNDVGVAAAYAKTLAYYGAKSGDTASKSTAKALLDGMWNVYVPNGWSGTMPNGDAITSSSTFSSIRSFYKDDPAWSEIEAYLKGGAAPVFTYHRFWAQADIALAMGEPRLTTVRQPIEEAGRAMIRLLLEEMEEGAVAWRHVILRTELVVRDST
ncbi:hypothetical protein QFZ55_001076 [Streptomyces luteogriseus]|nr:hypothetical protein [Streptomyces luteogriseus]